MRAEIVGREPELRKMAAFLDSAAEGTSALYLVGGPGIGKTTLWEAGLEEGRRRGYRVLSCRPVESEAPLSYAALADLLATVPEVVLGVLPRTQRIALEAALLRSSTRTGNHDHRAVATGLLSVLNGLAREAPVLVAIDDLQWLDASSRRALEFAVRRRSARIGILASIRSTARDARYAEAQLSDGEQREHLEVGPLSLGSLSRLLKQRTGRTYSRPAMVRVLGVSGGNPFFALELARVLGDMQAQTAGMRYPATLADVARARLAHLDPRAAEVLLAAAALAVPTVEVLERLQAGATASLERAEELEVVEIEGNRVRFAHPLLASGVYAMASPARRRDIHRRLAAAGLDPEERARHLALAAVKADAETIAALDEAALRARQRGAPAAAAELLELALRLGADDSLRRLTAARHHFDSGDPLRARALLEETIERLHGGLLRAEAQSLLASVRLHDDSYAEAAGLLEQALEDAGDNARLRVRIQLQLGYVLTNLGRVNDAVAMQPSTLEDAERLADRALLASALAASAITRFLNGQGLDEA